MARAKKTNENEKEENKIEKEVEKEVEEETVEDIEEEVEGIEDGLDELGTEIEEKLEEEESSADDDDREESTGKDKSDSSDESEEGGPEPYYVEPPAKRSRNTRKKKETDEEESEAKSTGKATKASASKTTAKKSTAKKATESEEENAEEKPTAKKAKGTRVRERVIDQNTLSMGGLYREMAQDPTVSLTGSVEAKTATGETMDAYQDIVSSQRSGAILAGSIASIPPAGEHLYATIYYGPFEVIIPFDKLVDQHEQLPTVRNTMTEAQKERYLLNNRLGAQVEFVITSVDRENRLATGDRLAAMETRRKNILSRKGPDGERFIREGIKLECRVVAVSRTGLFVESSGLEGNIPINEISYFYNDTRQYQPGDFIEARITAIGGDDPDNPELTLSRKQCERDPYEMYAGRMTRGTLLAGHVMKLSSTGTIMVKLDNGVDCAAAPPSERSRLFSVRPHKGSRCTIRIVYMDDAHRLAHGVVTHITD